MVSASVDTQETIMADARRSPRAVRAAARATARNAQKEAGKRRWMRTSATSRPGMASA